MGLPSKRRTPRSKRERAAHFALKAMTLGRCLVCAAVVRPHLACSKCGNYRGRTVVDTKKRAQRKLRRKS